MDATLQGAYATWLTDERAGWLLAYCSTNDTASQCGERLRSRLRPGRPGQDAAIDHAVPSTP